MGQGFGTEQQASPAVLALHQHPTSDLGRRARGGT